MQALHRSLRAIALSLVCAGAATGAQAEDLLQVYRDAKNYDAQYSGARYARDAGVEKLSQGRAQYLPSVILSASSTRTNQEVTFDNPALPPDDRSFRSTGYVLTLTQPLWRRQNFLLHGQGEWQARQAEAGYAQAGQDLILRVAQAYFDVLGAQDSLALVQAQKTAISEQLAQAKRNFEVGTATITDTHEAQSRYDLVTAQEIAAQNDLDNKRQALGLIAGKEYGALKPLKPDVTLAAPNPANMQTWVEMAEKQGYAVQVQQAAAEIAALEASRQSGGHQPTLDLVATRSHFSQTGSSTSSLGADITATTVGVQLTVPIYQGGSVSSRAREAAAGHNKAREDLEIARRTAALAARQSYLGVLSGQAQVKALEQALVSSRSALASNKLGYEVGARINIDVLNAQQQVFSTQRDLALARYNAINAQLKLKATAASLGETDLEEVNRALLP